MRRARKLIFYRVAATDPPTEVDFYSQARRRTKLPPEEATEEELQAFYRISVWDSLAAAEALALRYRKMGEYVVTLDIPDSAPIRSFPIQPGPPAPSDPAINGRQRHPGSDGL